MADFSYQAKQAADELKKNLQNQLYGKLEGINTNQQQIAQNQTNTLLQNLANQEQAYQSSYQDNARQNYINQVLGKQTVTDQLKRMGLYNSGYGVSQLADVDATAAQNLTSLQNALQENIGKINTQRNEAQTNLQNTLLDLESDYLNNQLKLEQYLNEEYKNEFNSVYNRLFSEDQAAKEAAYRAQQIAFQREQAALENARYEREYADQLAQLEGFISSGDKTEKSRLYDLGLQYVNAQSNKTYRDEAQAQDQYSTVLDYIDNLDITASQYEKLKKQLDTSYKNWVVRPKETSSRLEAAKQGYNSNPLASLFGLNY